MDRGAGTYRSDRTGVICVRVGDTEASGRTKDNMRGIRIYLTEKESAGRYVLLSHTFSLGRGVAVHKSAEDAL